MRRCQSRPPHLAPESRLGSNHRQRVDFGATSLHISVTPPIQSATEAGHVGWSRRGHATDCATRVAGGPANGVPEALGNVVLRHGSDEFGPC